jgi:hypothetical protein
MSQRMRVATRRAMRETQRSSKLWKCRFKWAFFSFLMLFYVTKQNVIFVIYFRAIKFTDMTTNCKRVVYRSIYNVI